MANAQFTAEFKAQIIQEVKQIHNVSYVARKHNISNKNIYNWIKQGNLKNTEPYLVENKKLEDSRFELMILKDLLKKLTKLRCSYIYC